jgi:CheY-like chemotaxis protein
MLKGEISVDSLPQRGSTFTVRLPVDGGATGQGDNPEDAAARIVEATEHRSISRPLANRRSQVATVLIVEGDPALRELMERYLSGEGFRVVSAGRAEEALTLVGQHRPSVLMLDAEEAGLDVPEVLNRLKGDSTAVPIPVVIIGSDSHMQEARRVGAADYISKPINWQVLAAIAKKWVRAGNSRTRALSQANMQAAAVVVKLGS